MRTKLISMAILASAFAALAVPGMAQSIRSEGETGLVGMKLYDTGMRLLQVYGDPDEILPLGAVSSGGGPAGGGGGGGGGRGGKFGGGGGGGGAGAGVGGVSVNAPFDFGDQMFQGQSVTPELQAGAARTRGGGRGAAGGGGGGAAGRGGAAVAGQSYLRWVYNREGCRYSFILDKNDRIVQIEAIGLENTKVRTRKGIGFGNTFKDVMEAYQIPESYQISGDTIIMQYLTRDKVAFRLNRLAQNKPHVVTAIVIAAGKT